MAKKMKLRISTRLLKKKVRRGGDARLAKHCRFTSGEVPVSAIDYKNAVFLRNFLTERGKIISCRISGNAARYQRLIAREIKKARIMALLPYLALERRPTTERGSNERPERERGSYERRSSNSHASQASLG